MALLLVQLSAGLLTGFLWRWEIYDDSRAQLEREIERLYVAAGNLIGRLPDQAFAEVRRLPSSGIALLCKQNTDTLFVSDNFPDHLRPESRFALPYVTGPECGFFGTPDRKYLLLSRQQRASTTQTFFFEAALDLDLVEVRVLRAMLLVCGTILTVTGIMTLLLHLVSGRLTRPLQLLADRMKAWSPSSHGTRIPEDSTIGELLEMQRSFNRLLDEVDLHHGRLNRFSTDVAHELRTAIAASRLELEVALQRKRTAKEYRAALESGLVSIEALGAIVEDLLLIARIEAGRSPLRLQPMALLPLVREVIENLAPVFEERSLQLRFLADGDPIVDLDRDRFRRALANLLDNAEKFSPPSGLVEVRVSQDANHATLSVGDRGRGIPEGEISGIFQRFVRASNALDTRGSGLGLAITHSLILAHSGKIKAENRPEGGCVLSITLPLSKGTGEDPNKPGLLFEAPPE